MAVLYFIRNRHKGDTSGHGRKREPQPPASQANSRSLSGSQSDTEREKDSNKDVSRKSTLLDSITKTDKSKTRRSMNKISLLAVMDEKSEKPKNSGLLCVPLSLERQKILVKNEIDDNRSDKSNVPLAILYKK